MCCCCAWLQLDVQFEFNSSRMLYVSASTVQLTRPSALFPVRSALERAPRPSVGLGQTCWQWRRQDENFQHLRLACSCFTHLCPQDQLFAHLPLTISHGPGPARPVEFSDNTWSQSQPHTYKTLRVKRRHSASISQHVSVCYWINADVGWRDVVLPTDTSSINNLTSPITAFSPG